MKGDENMTIKKLIPALLAIGAFAVSMPAVAARDDSQRGEANLAKILDGRSAGKPVKCLDPSQRRNMQVVDRTALVFKDGDTYYVNRPDGVNFLTWGDIPVFNVWGSELCSKDIVHLHDSSTFMPGATMVMGEFVPYRRNG
jgi:hypothetical protein